MIAARSPRPNVDGSTPPKSPSFDAMSCSTSPCASGGTGASQRSAIRSANASVDSAAVEHEAIVEELAAIFNNVCEGTAGRTSAESRSDLGRVERG